MHKHLSLALLLAALTACGNATEDAPVNEGGTPAVAEPAASGPDASATAIKFAPGQNLIVLKDKASCRETGSAAGDPWELSKGAFVKFVASEAGEARVEHAPGMECVVAADALGPA